MFRRLVVSAAGQQQAPVSQAVARTGMQFVMAEPGQLQEPLPQRLRTTVPMSTDFFPPMWSIYNRECLETRHTHLRAVMQRVDLLFGNGVPAPKPERGLLRSREQFADSNPQRPKSNQQEFKQQPEPPYESGLKRQKQSTSDGGQKDTENSQRELQPLNIFTETQQPPAPPDGSRLKCEKLPTYEERTEQPEPRRLTRRLGDTPPRLLESPGYDSAPELQVLVKFNVYTSRWTGAASRNLEPRPAAASEMCTDWRPIALCMWRASSDSGYESDDSQDGKLRNKSQTSQPLARSIFVSFFDPGDIGNFRYSSNSGYGSGDSQDGKARNQLETSQTLVLRSWLGVGGIGNFRDWETVRVSAAGSGGVNVYADRHNGLGSETLAQDLNRESRKRKSKASASESSSDPQQITTKKRKPRRQAGECSGYRCPFKVYDPTVDCGRTLNMCYSNMGELKTHLRRKHIRAKICDICGARFGTDRELNRHLESERRCQSPAEPVASVSDNDLSHEQFLLEHPGVKWRALYFGMHGVPVTMTNMEKCGRLNCRNGKANSGTDDPVDTESSPQVSSSERPPSDQQASMSRSPGSHPFDTLSLSILRAIIREEIRAIVSEPAGISQEPMRMIVRNELERLGLMVDLNIGSTPGRALEQCPLNLDASEPEGPEQLAVNGVDPSPISTITAQSRAQAQGLDTFQGLSEPLHNFQGLSEPLHTHPEASEDFLDFLQSRDGLSNAGFDNFFPGDGNNYTQDEPGFQW